MRIPLFLLLLTALLLPLSSCTDDDSGTDPVQTFSLLITNKTPLGFHLYQSPTDAGSGFSKAGFVLSNINYRVNSLTVGITYTFRLVEEGNAVENFAHETSISSDGEEKTWTLY